MQRPIAKLKIIKSDVINKKNKMRWRLTEKIFKDNFVCIEEDLFEKGMTPLMSFSIPLKETQLKLFSPMLSFNRAQENYLIHETGFIDFKISLTYKGTIE